MAGSQVTFSSICFRQEMSLGRSFLLKEKDTDKEVSVTWENVQKITWGINMAVGGKENNK